MERPVLKSVKRRRRQRSVSVQAEINAKAKQILKDRMAEAMTAATLMIVSRKQDEITALLRSIGAEGASVGMAQGGAAGTRMVVQHSAPAQPPVEHPCVQCGREGVRKTKRNKFNPQGSWYCLAHVRLATTSDFEDQLDSALLGNQSGPPIIKKPVIAPSPPAQITVEVPPPAPMADAVEPTGESSLEAAMSALGVAGA